MLSLAQKWHSLASHYSEDKNLITALWTEIEKAYTQPNRHYHNLVHIEFMATQALNFTLQIQDFDTLLFSIFYHDLVYVATRTNNEEQSAAMAKKRLATLQVSSEMVDKCGQQIIATKTHSSNGDSDTNYLLDFDLMILGTGWETYQQYAANIRKEYSLFPDFVYKPGRREVLQSFLAKDRIFKTEKIHQQFEPQARQNISRELQSL